MIVELCAKSWQVFSVGRVIAYLAVGLIENACPSYEAEVTPAPLRGFVAGSLIMLVSMKLDNADLRPLWVTSGEG